MRWAHCNYHNVPRQCFGITICGGGRGVPAIYKKIKSLSPFPGRRTHAKRCQFSGNSVFQPKFQSSENFQLASSSWQRGRATSSFLGRWSGTCHLREGHLRARQLWEMQGNVCISCGCSLQILNRGPAKAKDRNTFMYSQEWFFIFFSSSRKCRQHMSKNPLLLAPCSERCWFMEQMRYVGVRQPSVWLWSPFFIAARALYYHAVQIRIASWPSLDRHQVAPAEHLASSFLAIRVN